LPWHSCRGKPTRAARETRPDRPRWLQARRGASPPALVGTVTRRVSVPAPLPPSRASPSRPTHARDRHDCPRESAFRAPPEGRPSRCPMPPRGWPARCSCRPHDPPTREFPCGLGGGSCGDPRVLSRRWRHGRLAQHLGAHRRRPRVPAARRGRRAHGPERQPVLPHDVRRRVGHAAHGVRRIRGRELVLPRRLVALRVWRARSNLRPEHGALVRRAGRGRGPEHLRRAGRRTPGDRRVTARVFLPVPRDGTRVERSPWHRRRAGVQ
jgi:hypothetical protein